MLNIGLVALIICSIPSTERYTFTTPVEAQVLNVYDSLSVKEKVEYKIKEMAATHQVNAEVMEKVIACESTKNPNAIGDGGKSRGLVQIHKPSWPEITDAQAFDIHFSVEFLASKLKEGKGRLWSCYRKYYN